MLDSTCYSSHTSHTKGKETNCDCYTNDFSGLIIILWTRLVRWPNPQPGRKFAEQKSRMIVPTVISRRRRKCVKKDRESTDLSLSWWNNFHLPIWTLLSLRWCSVDNGDWRVWELDFLLCHCGGAVFRTFGIPDIWDSTIEWTFGLWDTWTEDDTSPIMTIQHSCILRDWDFW